MVLNHDYNVPSKGTSNWHVPLNENFRRLDADVEVRDVEAAIDEYRPKSGAKFLAIDTERMFIGDGTNWNELASSGRSPRLDSVRANALNHMRYVPPSENLRGVQDAIEEASPGAYIELDPRGTYVGRSLSLPDFTTIRGNGATIRSEAGVTGDLLTTEDPEVDISMKCKLIDLIIDGNKDNGAVGNAVYGSFWQSRFVNCEFLNASQRAFWLAGSNESTDDNVFDQCRFLASGDGLAPDQSVVRIGSGKSSYQAVGVATLRRCWFGSNASAALGLRGNDHSVHNCKFYSNAGSAIVLDRAQNSIIAQCDIFGAPGSNPLTVSAREGVNAQKNVIIGNRIWGSFENAIQFDADDNDVTACLVHDNVIDATETNGAGFVASGTGSYSQCSLQSNVFTGAFAASPLRTVPRGWTAANNVL